MAIHGIESAAVGAGGVPERLRPGAQGPGSLAGAGRAGAGRSPGDAAHADVDGAAVGPAAPPGTDPALWSVLTTEERAFFARAQLLGPLTYGPGQPSNDAPRVQRGGRLDVKV